MPGLNRFLRVTPGGLLRTDKTKAKAEENLDGKYLLRCADPQLSAEDIAVGYKQLLEVERGWRDMKSVLDLRPVYHRLEERIRAHVLLCWLALLLVRVAENQAGQTWPVMRRELDRIHLGTFTGPAGTFRQRTELPKPARDLLARLSIDAPRKIHELTPAPDPSPTLQPPGPRDTPRGPPPPFPQIRPAIVPLGAPNYAERGPDLSRATNLAADGRCPDPRHLLPQPRGPRLPDHRHRAVSVVDALLADRSEQQPAEAAQPTGANHQQIGIR